MIEISKQKEPEEAVEIQIYYAILYLLTQHFPTETLLHVREHRVEY